MKRNAFRWIAAVCMAAFLVGINGCAKNVNAREGEDPITPVAPSEREVGIAYSLWMDRDVWSSSSNTWGTPTLGPYDSRERRIIRQHALWLADAGVDFIWLDWSNNVTYDPDEL